MLVPVNNPNNNTTSFVLIPEKARAFAFPYYEGKLENEMVYSIPEVVYFDETNTETKNMLDEFVISPYPETGRRVGSLSYTIPTRDNFVQKRINQLQYMENTAKFEDDVKKMILKIHRTTG
eukprot:1384964-Rhodomonas_salina.1